MRILNKTCLKLSGVHHLSNDKIRAANDSIWKCEMLDDLEADIRIMKTPSKGGRFDSKSRWIYMTPLQTLANKSNDQVSYHPFTDDGVGIGVGAR